MPNKKWHQAYGSQGLVRYINELGCLVCGYSPADAAHVKSRGAGGGWYQNLVPLCRKHHTEQHTIGIKTFEKKYDLNLKATAEALSDGYHLDF
jgi:5-methylcytosine-specific restriction endonuclease McrA